MWITLAIALVKIALLIGGLMTAAAYLVLVERWMAAWIQDRLGPNRVGIPLTRIRLWGLGQPIADGVKFIFKEEFTPGHVDRVLYFLGPVVMLMSAIAVWAVIPFGSILPTDLGLPETEEPIRLILAPYVDVGIVFIFAVNSIAVYGLLLGSWASNDKYAFLGGMRSGAQLISYEIPLGLGILGVLLVSGSLRLDAIILQQAATGIWNVMAQPLGFLVFMIASFAEAARLPFDLPEAEQELVGGYHTEYSGIKLMMYLVGEYLHMITAAYLMAILFFGGWHFWGLTGSTEQVGWLGAILRVVVLNAKAFGLILFFMVVRWSLPRFRFDQLMKLAWKVMLPLGMVNLVFVAVWIAGGDRVSRSLGISEGLLMAAAGWVVLLASWIAIVVVAPATSDNRPRRGALADWSEEMETLG